MRTEKRIEILVREINSHYKKHKRNFPWRRTKNPYYILVSEIMLQQTQAGKRTEEKYKAFIKRFPNFKTLAKASLRAVLGQWQGLGYNRRAKALKELAQIVVSRHGGKLPRTDEELVKLPGVGPYTAGAICAFAFNKPAIFIETNIRTVFIHFFFNKTNRKISDKEILELVEQTLPKSNSREWFYMLMDYGTMLKKKYPNPNRKSLHYLRQSRFEGSNRQLRGQIIKLFLKEEKLTQTKIEKMLKIKTRHVGPLLQDLVNEGFLTQCGYILALK